MTALPRRIIHVASGREWRGGQNQVLLLARALAARRDEVEQVVVTGRDTPLARRLAAEFVPVAPVGWRAALSPAALARTVRETSRTPSLLHAHDAHAVTLAGLAASLTRAPFVATRRVDFRLHRTGFWARADRIIAISDAVRGVLLADGIPAGRIVRVHSGIDLDAVREVRPGRIREELGLPEGGPLRLGERVHLLGQVEEPLRLVAAADVFVMSSREEGLGTSVLDAMALDVPIAATRAGGIPEMLEGGAGLLSPPGDGPALAHSVDRLLGDPAVKASVLQAARSSVGRFALHNMAEGVLAVYRSLMEAVEIK